MDAKQKLLDEKLAGLLKQAADVAAQIQAREQGPGTPHFGCRNANRLSAGLFRLGEGISGLDARIATSWRIPAV